METELEALPDDALAHVLRGLPARSLATARCVCKAWRAIVDARALLLPHFLPHSVHGIFVNYIDHGRPHFFARPSSASSMSRGIDGMLGFMHNDHVRDWWSVMDHCNGLLVCDMELESELCVCNPATRRWTGLPRHAGRSRDYAGAYLVFDPAESPHYEVFLIPVVPEEPSPSDRRKVDEERRARLRQQEIDAPFFLDWFFSLPRGAIIADGTGEEVQQAVESSPSVNKDHEPDHDPFRLMEWPPSPWRLSVFSSRSGRWEDRAFVREGEPAGTVKDMRLDPLEPTWRGPRRRYAVYQRGVLYVHCRGSFITRFSLSNDKYVVIKIPADIKDAKPYLGGSQNQVYFGIFDGHQLRVWILNESCGHIEWLLKYEADLGLYAHYVASLPYNNGRQLDGSWMVEGNTDVSDIDDDVEAQSNGSIERDSDKDKIYVSGIGDNVETQSDESIEWDSDNDDFFAVEAGSEQYCRGQFHILGFHPYKEVVFLVEWFGVAAYHLNTSKIQYLGNSRPKCYYRNHTNGISESFLYTPCMIGDLLRGDNTGQSLYED
ncbi:uncharacterized protein LOC133923759 [Phragmites australis]|uniref:uncharacterized protein LOC133923759 n=1 Tax=Phragmites australis TaxID=29695 RepID=UPI002D77B9EE|nr:uncharacterized protein LOC133923759 [Phragmites australis]